jgi:hypothetical protein
MVVGCLVLLAIHIAKHMGMIAFAAESRSSYHAFTVDSGAEYRRVREA